MLLGMRTDLNRTLGAHTICIMFDQCVLRMCVVRA
jgi:hypothetical protein